MTKKQMLLLKVQKKNMGELKYRIIVSEEYLKKNLN